MNFKVGDKVKLVAGREVGEVVQHYADGRVLVRLEDQLEIEVVEQDLVLTEPTRQVAAQPAKAAPPVAWQGLAAGIYLVLDRPQPMRLNAYLLNYEETSLIYVVLQPQEDKVKGLVQGTLPSGTQQLLFNTNPENLLPYAELTFQWLYFSPQAFAPLPAAEVSFKLRSRHLMLAPRHNPLLGREAVVIPLKPTAPVPTLGQLLQSTAPKPSTQTPVIDAAVVDLHIEKLAPDAAHLSSGQLLALQLAEFEKKLDDALLHKRPSVTFIHGLGKGRLKQELHKRLEKHPHVKDFHLDSSERFGFGATKVVLR